MRGRQRTNTCPSWPLGWAQFYKAVLKAENTAEQTSLLSKKWVGHQSQQCELHGLLAGNLCLASFCSGYRLYEIGPRSFDPSSR